MTTQEVLDHYGGMKPVCRLLDVMPQTIYKWGERPPRGRQFELYVISNQQLKVDEEYYVENNTAG